LPPDLLHDQKQIWLFPVSVAHGHHLKPTLAVVGITAGLLALDAPSGKYFQKTQSFNGFNRAFSGPHTALATELFPAAFYIVSLVRRDSYGQKTFILAAETVIDSEILTSVMKDATRRLNPAAIPPNGNFSDTWFQKKPGSWVRGVGSFPSGHTIAAFSVATIFADRYPHPQWHRWLAYGLATLVGFSRVSLQTHFPSDVFAGAALGYVIGHYIVFRAHTPSASTVPN
jgi:membrane-associated phospholipid phosphatase